MREIWIPLTVQVIFAVLGVELFRCRVLRGLKNLGQPGLVLDVWGPIALVLPLLFMTGWIDGRVAGAGWPAVGGPVACGLLALAVALMVGLGPRERRPLGGLAIAAWTGTGLVLLLQSAAGEMTLWTGQCSFAAAAVLLWMNTPASGPVTEKPSPEMSRVGWALALAILCAVGQGWAALKADADVRPWCAAVSMCYAAAILTLSGLINGPEPCLRLGGWAATLGVLFGLGLISLCVLVPEVYHIIVDRWLVTEHGWPRPPIVRVAYGFGTFAVEGTLLLLVGGAWVLADRWRHPGRRVGGIAVLVAALAIVVLRLLGMA